LTLFPYTTLFRSFVLFLGLAFGMVGFLAKFVIQWALAP
jgi:hypothetical protein